MAENLFIQLIARLNKSLSRAQIQTDLKDIEKTPFYVRMIGRLNRSLTRRNIENDVQIAARNINGCSYRLYCDSCGSNTKIR